MKPLDPSRRHSAARIATVLLVAMWSVSCAKTDDHKPLYPVSGRVVMDGKPVPYAFVVFHPQGVTGSDAIRPRAQAGANGSFALSTYAGADGAPPGEYRITVEKYKAPTEADKGPPVNLLPARYARADTSNLTARVQEGRNELPSIQLKR